VTRLVLRGTSTRAITDMLCISAHTVQDHLKAVFDKVGVHRRRDLVGLLMGAAGPPRQSDGVADRLTVPAAPATPRR
jgi:hypothetical protein